MLRICHSARDVLFVTHDDEAAGCCTRAPGEMLSAALHAKPPGKSVLHGSMRSQSSATSPAPSLLANASAGKHQSNVHTAVSSALAAAVLHCQKPTASVLRVAQRQGCCAACGRWACREPRGPASARTLSIRPARLQAVTVTINMQIRLTHIAFASATCTPHACASLPKTALYTF